MKVVRLTTNYPAYLSQFAQRHPGIESLPYEEQHARLMAERFGWSDAWTHALAPLGVTMWEPVANFAPAQRSWARMRGLKCDEGSWLTTIAAAQVTNFEPDVLFVDDAGTFGPAFVRELRERVRSIRLTVYWCGAPVGDLDEIAAADLVLSNLPGLVDFLKRAGKRAVHFRHAFDRRVLDALPRDPEKSCGISFAGSLVRRAKYHVYREEVLAALASSTDIRVFSSVEAFPPSPQPQRERILHRALGPLLERRRYVLETREQRDAALAHARRRGSEGLRDELESKLHPPVFGLDMYRVLQTSRVTINVHLDYFGESAANMRLFEATGVGCCLLSDWKYDLPSQFAPESEIVAFRSAGECVERARALLDDPRRADEIGRNGQRRTLRDHTFERRAPELMQVLMSAL